MKTSPRKTPWIWIPTLYFAEGLPYAAVMVISVLMYKRLGLSNTEIALYTSWLNLPWVIKPIWSPFIDLIRTKRSWILTTQGLLAAGLAGIAFFLPTSYCVSLTLAIFWLLAFSSATHDIAADGYYMLALDNQEQSVFLGIRNTCYRAANIFGQGLLVALAGLLENFLGNIPLAWSLIFYIMAGIFLLLYLYHRHILPHPDTDHPHLEQSARQLLNGFFRAFSSFFRKEHLGLMFFFLLSYRLGEAQLSKMIFSFLIDPIDKGGLALSTTSIGMIYGTIGMVALLVGGIIGGIVVARHGIKRWIMPMALAINLPDLLYVWLAHTQHSNLYLVGVCVSIEQLGYGFGFTAYMLYLIYISQGEYRTSHYAIGTAFMALGLMLPGMPAGWIQEQLGYTQFFVWVCFCTLPGIWAAWKIRQLFNGNSLTFNS